MPSSSHPDLQNIETLCFDKFELRSYAQDHMIEVLQASGWICGIDGSHPLKRTITTIENIVLTGCPICGEVLREDDSVVRDQGQESKDHQMVPRSLAGAREASDNDTMYKLYGAQLTRSRWSIHKFEKEKHGLSTTEEQLALLGDNNTIAPGMMEWVAKENRRVAKANLELIKDEIRIHLNKILIKDYGYRESSPDYQYTTEQIMRKIDSVLPDEISKWLHAVDPRYNQTRMIVIIAACVKYVQGAIKVRAHKIKQEMGEIETKTSETPNNETESLLRQRNSAGAMEAIAA